MSRTGSIADGPSVPAQAPGGRVRAAANRLQDASGDIPGFPEHVLALESVAGQVTTPDLSPTVDQGTIEIAESSGARGRRFHSESMGKGTDIPRMNDAMHRAMLMLECNDTEHGVLMPATPASAALPPTEGDVPEAMASSLRLSARDDASLPATAVARGADPALSANVITPRVAGLAPRGTAREAISDQHGGSSRSRDTHPAGNDRSGQQISMRTGVRETRTANPVRSFGRADEVPVKIVRQEAHLAPAQRPSLGAQLAGVVATELGARPMHQMPHTPARLLAGPVLRVLKIQLQPAELGTVTIRMALESGRLELQLDAQKATTAELIRRDQGVLASLLRSAGYDVEGLIVHVADPDRSSTASGLQMQHSAQQPAQSALQPHSGWSQADGRSNAGMGAHAQSQSGRQGGVPADPQTTATAEVHTGPPRPRGVYV